MNHLFSGQYGNRFAQYGNIQLGAAQRFIQGYGAWPEEKPKQKGMLYGDWQDRSETYAEEIEARIAHIHKLKEEIELTHDLSRKNEIRELVRIERQAKERAFKLKAIVEEEEAAFMLLH